MPNPIATLTTARLLAEAIAPLHFHDLHRLLSDPHVMKTLSADGKPLSEAATREQIDQNVDHWRQCGFGLWVFHRKLDGVFVGHTGLKTYQIDGKDVIGLACAVMPDYWNQGFATEMAQASLEVGFGHLGFPEIGSWTLPGNLPSQRVMEKLGFRYERDFEFAGLPHRLYRLVAGGWQPACGLSPWPVDTPSPLPQWWGHRQPWIGAYHLRASKTFRGNGLPRSQLHTARIRRGPCKAKRC